MQNHYLLHTLNLLSNIQGKIRKALSRPNFSPISWATFPVITCNVMVNITIIQQNRQNSQERQKGSQVWSLYLLWLLGNFPAIWPSALIVWFWLSVEVFFFFSFNSVESCLYLMFLILMVLLCDCCFYLLLEFFFLFAFSLKRLVAFLYFCFVVVFVFLKCFLMFCIFLKKLGFFSYKAEQSLQGMESQEKEAQKD